MESTRIVSERSFPHITLPAPEGGRPVEVTLIAQLDPGAGDALADSAGQRQRQHPAHHDALDEPSARLSAPDFARDDPTSLFSFSVGPHGHPFHRHAGRRVFTAVSGSGGARLRFSTATFEAMQVDPGAFLRALHHVEVPPDCMFTVRFDGGTWHQFQPLRDGGGDRGHPALFALSCHPDELAGLAEGPLKAQTAAGAATLASLTDVLPESVAVLLVEAERSGLAVPTTTLALHAAPFSWQQRLCARVRGVAGHFRRRTLRRASMGFVGHRAALPAVQCMHGLPTDSLLHAQLAEDHQYQDCALVRLQAGRLAQQSPTAVLAALLQAFVDHPPAGVGRLMRLRNLLVKPLGLRTAQLGCPVSSLACEGLPCTGPAERFLQRFPVLAQQHDAHGAQVILGADDRHLRFRSCVAVRIEAGQVEISLSTRVACRNRFGRCYMGIVDRVHRRYIAPLLLTSALAELLAAATVPDAAVAALARD